MKANHKKILIGVVVLAVVAGAVVMYRKSKKSLGGPAVDGATASAEPIVKRGGFLNILSGDGEPIDPPPPPPPPPSGGD